MFLVAANTRQALVGQKEWITTGSSGIQVQFLFSDDWEGLSKFAVFRNAEIEESRIPIALPESNLTELPAENCAAEYVDEKVYVGVYGSDGLGHIVIPTIWVSLGVLKEGAAYEGMDPPQPTPDMWAQILAIAQNAGAENAEAAEEAAGEAEAASLAVQDMDVEAETLAAGSAASVEKTVDPETGAVTLNFGIPAGAKGDQGTPGQDGTTPDFRIGTVETLNPGQSATATITGTPAQPVLNLGIPQGQKGDPGGDSGTSDYTELENKPQINGHTLSGNQSAADLGLGTYSKPASGIPKTDLASDVQASLGKADSALQTAPVTSVNSKTGAVTLGAGDVGFDGQEQYAAGSVGAKVAELNRQLNDETTDLDTKAPVILETASGAIASFDDGADSMPIRKIVATIEPVQSGTGDPSPDNVRPISGWTGANIVGAGRNLAIGQAIKDVVFAKIPEERRGYNAETGWLWFQPYQGGGYPTIIGAGSPNSISKIIFKEAAQYTIIFEVTSQDDANDLNIAVAYTDGTTKAFKSSEKVSGKIIYTTPVGKTLKNIYIGYYVNKWTSIKCDTFCVYEGVATENVPQEQGSIIPINWETEAGTVYGGTVTLNEDGSADVFSDWYSRTFDGDTYYLTSGAGKTTGLTDIYECFDRFGSGGLNGIPRGISNSPEVNLSDKAICRPAKASVTNNDLLQFQTVSGSNYLRMYFNVALLDGITSSSTSAEILAAMRTYFRANPVTIVLRCITGQSYHFSDIGQLKTFLGTNNVWIDTGAITECDYPADTKLFLTARDEEITGNIAPIENGTTASKAYAQGAYFWHDTKFCKALTAIASGATFTNGTNYTETTVAAELLAAQN